jgi:hypothetical protein
MRQLKVTTSRDKSAVSKGQEEAFPKLSSFLVTGSTNHLDKLAQLSFLGEMPATPRLQDFAQNPRKLVSGPSTAGNKRAVNRSVDRGGLKSPQRRIASSKLMQRVRTAPNPEFVKKTLLPEEKSPEATEHALMHSPFHSRNETAPRAQRQMSATFGRSVVVRDVHAAPPCAGSPRVVVESPRKIVSDASSHNPDGSSRMVSFDLGEVGFHRVRVRQISEKLAADLADINTSLSISDEHLGNAEVQWKGTLGAISDASESLAAYVDTYFSEFSHLLRALDRGYQSVCSRFPLEIGKLDGIIQGYEAQIKQMRKDYAEKVRLGKTMASDREAALCAHVVHIESILDTNEVEIRNLQQELQDKDMIISTQALNLMQKHVDILNAQLDSKCEEVSELQSKLDFAIHQLEEKSIENGKLRFAHRRYRKDLHRLHEVVKRFDGGDKFENDSEDLRVERTSQRLSFLQEIQILHTQHASFSKSTQSAFASESSSMVELWELEKHILCKEIEHLRSTIPGDAATLISHPLLLKGALLSQEQIKGMPCIRGAVKPVHWVLSTLHQSVYYYGEYVQQQQPLKLKTFQEGIFDFLLLKHGNKASADIAVVELLRAVQFHRGSDAYIDLYGNVLDGKVPWAETLLLFEMMREIETATTGISYPDQSDTGSCYWLCSERANAILQQVFSSVEFFDLDFKISLILREATPVPAQEIEFLTGRRYQGETRIPVPLFLDLALRELHQMLLRRCIDLEKYFRKYCEEDTQLLNFNQFLEMMVEVEPTYTKEEKLQLYRHALKLQNHHNLRHFSEQGYISQSGIQLLAQESPLLITQTRSAVPNGQQLSATESERVHAACSSAWPQFKAFIAQLLPRVENLFPYRAFKIKSLQSQLEDCVIDSKHSSLALHHYLLLLLEVYLCQSEYQASIGELPIQALEEELRTWLTLMQKKESAGMERLKVLRNDIHLADLSQLMRLTNGVVRLQMHFRRRLARRRQAATVEDSQCAEEDQPAS